MVSDIYKASTGFACATRRRAIAILATMFVVTWAFPAQAQIARSWNTGNGNWSIALNWLPNGVPGPLDGAFIGASAAAENATVTLDQNDTIAGLQITDGMTLDTNGNQLIVNGNTLVSDANPGFVLSTLSVVGGGSLDFRTNNLTTTDSGHLELVGGIVQVDGVFHLQDGAAPGLQGSGVVNFTGASGPF